MWAARGGMGPSGAEPTDIADFDSDAYNPLREIGEVLRYNIRQVKLSRAEFLRWAEEQGYRRPTFWDGSEPTVSAAATTEPTKLGAHSLLRDEKPGPRGTKPTQHCRK